MFLFILESVGTTELLVILGAALVFFGPRRLPQLSRQLGKSLTEFRRASDDFKRTWEREVNLENFEKGVDPSKDASILDKATERLRSVREAAARDVPDGTDTSASLAPSVTPVDPSMVQPHESPTMEPEPSEAAPALSKHDWL